jgi:hypothetical protein
MHFSEDDNSILRIIRMRSEGQRERLSARNRAETHRSGYESSALNLPVDVKLFKLDKAGTRRIDIIPYHVGQGNPGPGADPGSLYFERTYFVHRSIGADQTTYVCPAKTANKRCPICEYRAKLVKDPDADEDEVKALAPKERQLWNVIDLDEPDEGIQVWDISYHLFGKLLDQYVKDADADEDIEYYADPVDGKTLKLGVAEKSFGGRSYYEVLTIGFKDRKTKYDKSTIDAAFCLDDLVQVLPHDKLKAIFFQAEDEDVEDDEPEEKPSRKSRKPVKVEIDEEGDDIIDDEDEEVEEKPKTKSRPGTTDEPTTAEEAGLEEGMQVEHAKFGKCDIVRVSKDSTSLTLEDMDAELHKGVGCDEVKVSTKAKRSSEEEEEEEPKRKKRKSTVQKDEYDDESDWK